MRPWEHTFVSPPGIKIAIGDYGTGYSSLPYLRRFPVATTVSLARTLGLEVTAEGVESVERLAHLGELGLVQEGYHLSRPLPAGPVPELLGAPSVAGDTAV